MKIVIIGGTGQIGSAVAWDLARDREVERIGLVASRPQSLQKTKQWLDCDKVAIHAVSAANRDAMIAVMKEYDAGVLALPDRKSDYQCAEHAIAAGLNVVDMLEDYHRHPEPCELEGMELLAHGDLDGYGERLHEQAIRNGITFLDGMGFAPGLTNITLGNAIRQLDQAETAIARVGGIPTKEAAARHPLGYMITWSFAHVLREYSIRLKIRRNGQIVETPAGGDRETFRFQEFGRDVELESAVIAGIPSLLYTRSQLKNLVEKTIRWPGHWQAVETLRECGLLDLEPVTFAGRPIVPREFLASLLTPKLRPRPGETDCCIMYNTALGQKNGVRMKIEHFLWEEADPANGISAIQRTTAFPAAIAASLLARRLIPQKGIVAPEDAVIRRLYDDFVSELANRGIHIKEMRQEIQIAQPDSEC